MNYRITRFGLIRIYFISILFGIVLWRICPETVHFIGASSIVYAFLIALGTGRGLIAFFALGWIFIFIIAGIVCYVFAMRRGFLLPIKVLAGLELIASLLCIAFKLFIKNYIDLKLAFWGLAVRTLLYLFMFFIEWRDI